MDYTAMLDGAGNEVTAEVAAEAVKCFAELWARGRFDCGPQDDEFMVRQCVEALAGSDLVPGGAVDLLSGFGGLPQAEKRFLKTLAYSRVRFVQHKLLIGVQVFRPQPVEQVQEVPQESGAI
jgi:hypothetical protein